MFENALKYVRNVHSKKKKLNNVLHILTHISFFGEVISFVYVCIVNGVNSEDISFIILIKFGLGKH